MRSTAHRVRTLNSARVRGEKAGRSRARIEIAWLRPRSFSMCVTFTKQRTAGQSCTRPRDRDARLSRLIADNVKNRKGAGFDIVKARSSSHERPSSKSAWIILGLNSCPMDEPPAIGPRRRSFRTGFETSSARLSIHDHPYG